MDNDVQGDHTHVALTGVVYRPLFKKCECCLITKPSHIESTVAEPLNVFDARTLPEKKIIDKGDLDKNLPSETKIDWTKVPCMDDLERGAWDIRPESDGWIRIHGRRLIPLEQMTQFPKEVWDKYDDVLLRCVNGYGFGPISDMIWKNLHRKDPLEVGSPPRRDRNRFFRRWLEGRDFY